MKAMRRYLAGITLATACASASAVPMFSISAGSGAPGSHVTVSLNHEPTVGLIGAVVLVQFGAGLDFLSATPGSLFPELTVLTPTKQDLDSVILTVSASDSIDDGKSGSLFDVTFGIRLGASGPIPVSFRCVPTDPDLNEDLVTDQSSADNHCFDYAIPFTPGSVTVLASNGQVPAPGTAALALLGIGLMGWVRWRRGMKYLVPERATRSCLRLRTHPTS